MDYCRTDDRVVAAYDVFWADQNLSDFADTLLRLLDVLEGEKNEVAEAAFEENCRTENQLLEAAKAANDAQEEVEDEMNEAAIAARNAREEIEDEMEEDEFHEDEMPDLDLPENDRDIDGIEESLFDF